MSSIKIKRNYLFFPDKERTGESDSGEPIYLPDGKLRLRVRWSGVKVDFNLGYRVKLSQWDRNTQRCKVKTTNLQKQSASLINGVIQHYENTIDAVFSAFELKKVVPTRNEVRAEFNLLSGRLTESEVQGDKSFFGHFDEFVKESGHLNDWTANTYEKFGAVRNHLEGFNANLAFSDLTEFGLIQYVNYLREEKDLRNSTISKQLGFLRWFLRWATANGACDTLDYVNFKPKLKTSERKVIFLEWDELMTVYNYQFNDSQGYLERVRDVFCFCSFTSLRYSDVANLRRSDVFDDYIQVTTIKTADSLQIELNDYSRAILEKYTNQEFENNLALPVISNQKMNEYLKEVGELCELDDPITITYYKGNERIDEVYPKHQLLTTHVGRRTFICNALMLGIAPQIVMKWTGHKDYKAMKPYIDIADSAKVEAMKLFNS